MGKLTLGLGKGFISVSIGTGVAVAKSYLQLTATKSYKFKTPFSGFWIQSLTIFLLVITFPFSLRLWGFFHNNFQKHEKCMLCLFKRESYVFYFIFYGSLIKPVSYHCNLSGQ